MDQVVQSEYDDDVVVNDERRNQLLREAAREFAVAGFEQASLNAVIRRCRMSKSSFYNVIASKIALYDLVIAEFVRSLAVRVRLPEPSSLGTDRYWDHVDELVGELAAALSADPFYADVGRMLYRRPPDDSVEATRLIASAEQWVHEVISVGRDCRAVRTDLPVSLQGELAFAMLHVFDEWGVRHFDELSTAQLGPVVDAQAGALRRLFAAD